jgi:hypothetical protein
MYHCKDSVVKPPKCCDIYITGGCGVDTTEWEPGRVEDGQAETIGDMVAVHGGVGAMDDTQVWWLFDGGGPSCEGED